MSTKLISKSTLRIAHWGLTIGPGYITDMAIPLQTEEKYGIAVRYVLKSNLHKT